MAELSVFVDESGDFGSYDFHSPYYIIDFVFHDQSIDISDQIQRFDNWINDSGHGKLFLHAGPIIRREEDFSAMNVSERRKILAHLAALVRVLNIKHKAFYVKKKHFSNRETIVEKLYDQIYYFLEDNFSYFREFDSIKIYYDSGQSEVTSIIMSVFSAIFSEFEYKKVLPQNYRLSQAADLLCTTKMTELKMKDKRLSKSEKYFFGTEKDFRKRYLDVYNVKIF